jgi:IS1 family transposase
MDANGQPIDVEIDETYFFHRKYHRGVRRRGTWVFGGVERGTNRCFMAIVNRRNRQTLEQLILQHVLPGSRIISDMWPAYANVNQLQGGIYYHDTVNHTLGFLNQQNPDIHTQTIEGLWRWAKRKIRYQSGTSRMLFPSYIAEFVWRKNFSPDHDVFSAFLTAIADQHPV